MIFQSCGPHGQDLQRLDINLLKPERLLVAPRGNVKSLRNAAAVTGWVQYQPRLQCPLLRYLPHFLAAFIVENSGEALHLPDPLPINPRQSSYKDQKGRKWSIGTLNRDLKDVLVPQADGTQIAVIGCAEWESENFAGVTNLNVRTLYMYHGAHRQVVISCNHLILFHTISYYFILFHNYQFDISYFFILFHNKFHIIFRNASLLFRHFRTETMS